MAISNSVLAVLTHLPSALHQMAWACMHGFQGYRYVAIGLLALSLSNSVFVFAQVPNLLSVASPKSSVTQYKIDTWQTEQGLPQNTVQTMYQTRAGYLWVGTAGGLARFDGMRFATFESTVAPEVAASPIFGFKEDAEGYLWIGYGRGAVRFRDGRFESVIDSTLTDGRRVWAFAQAPNGVMWIASENGLIRWDKGLTKVYKEADGLPSNRLRTLCFDREGVLWIGTGGGGLASFSAEKFTVFNAANGFPNPEVRHVLADPAGGVWAATAGGGLVHIDGGKEGKIKTYTMADGLPTDQLTQLARDKSGALWIGTWGEGVVRMSDARFTTISAAAGLGGDQIWSLLGDAEGSVWVGSWNGGLNRLSNRAFGVFGKPEGLLSDNVRSIMHTRDGATWVSTAGGGVSRLEGDSLKLITKKDGLGTNESSALLEDKDGAIWIGSYTQGISRLKQGKIDNFSLAQGLPNVDVRTIIQDRAGTIWAGTKSGLARFDGQRFVAVKPVGVPLEGVSTILEDRSGIFWLGTPGDGLFRYNPGDGTVTMFTRKDGLVSNWVLALHEDATGGLWIGSNGNGLNRLKNGRFSAIRTTDGLWDGTAHVMIPDQLGNLWMTCNRGFFRVALADLNAFADGKTPKVVSTGFGPGDALRSATFAGGLQPAGSMDPKGRLWLPSLKGLVIVDPARLPGSGELPPIIIEQVSVNGVVSVPKLGSGAVPNLLTPAMANTNESANTNAEIVLPPGSVPLAIRYTAGMLLNADRVRFRYQMEGLTPNWVEAGKAREAVFPALPHGTYQFRVAASLDGTRWREATQVLPIRVTPYYYQTSWFMALTGLGALAALFGVFRLRTHQLHKRHAEMERIVAEKTEALWQANEHLSRLSRTDALTGLANRRSLDETLEAEWRRGLRLQTSLAVVLIDIDSFKAYNDTLGHPEGDKCLIAVADVIRKISGRAGDFAARYGGEEFMVLVPGFDHKATAVYAETLRQACEAQAIPHPASPVATVVTISIGIAVLIPSEQSSVESLIAQADAALYRAKNEGRNCVR